MSAFICSDDTFSRIYSRLIVLKDSRWHEYTARQIKGMIDTVPIESVRDSGDLVASLVDTMKRANITAVSQRYNEAVEPLQPQSYKFIPDGSSNQQFLKDLECLRYQMSEGNVPESDIYKQVSELIKCLAIDLVHASPEYKRAGWDSDKED